MAKDQKSEPQNSLAVRSQFDQLGEVKKQFSEEQIKFIIETVAPGLNRQEAWLFLLKCNIMGLNPLLGEVTAYAAKDERGGRRLVFIAGRDGKRRAAFNTSKVEYIHTEAVYTKEAPYIVDGKTIAGEKLTVKVNPWEGGKLWGAVTTIKRIDRQEATVVAVPLSEYNRGNAVWKSKPETMIKKVSQSQALSEAFPEIMGGVYDESESWDEPRSAKEPEVVVEDGQEPPSDAQLQTLKALGYEGDEPATKQLAVEIILDLQKKKNEK